MTGYGVIPFNWGVIQLFCIAETFVDNHELKYLLAYMMCGHFYGGVRHF